MVWGFNSVQLVCAQIFHDNLELSLQIILTTKPQFSPIPLQLYIENTMFMSLISSLLGVTRKREGIGRLARAILRFLFKPDKPDIKRHFHGILFIMQYFLTFTNV